MADDDVDAAKDAVRFAATFGPLDNLLNGYTLRSFADTPEAADAPLYVMKPFSRCRAWWRTSGHASRVTRELGKVGSSTPLIYCHHETCMRGSGRLFTALLPRITVHGHDLIASDSLGLTPHGTSIVSLTARQPITRQHHQYIIAQLGRHGKTENTWPGLPETRALCDLEDKKSKPGELAKHAVSEGTKAVTKYTSSK
ncbi:Histone H2B type 2-E-like [Branchiostoma belcheri]|nr:Histone H2B type 2-E-like [Branchiostoma belcheri]